MYIYCPYISRNAVAFFFFFNFNFNFDVLFFPQKKIKIIIIILYVGTIWNQCIKEMKKKKTQQDEEK